MFTIATLCSPLCVYLSSLFISYKRKSDLEQSIRQFQNATLLLLKAQSYSQHKHHLVKHPNHKIDSLLGVI